MRTKPIILTTFANDKTAHLPLLEREREAIKHKLKLLEDRAFIEVKQVTRLTIQKLQKLLAELREDIVLFHYGGHADSNLIQTEDGDAYGKGLAGLLGDLPQLKLVFLNGCSTEGQVALLLAKGVKAIIATSVPIEDKTAVAFSEAFYQALANKFSIRHAFEFAKNSLKTIFDNPPNIEIFRVAVKRKEHQISEDCPWKFFVQETDADDLMAWQLPYYRQTPVVPAGFLPEMKANGYILLVLEEMCRYNKDIYTQMVESNKGKERKKDTSTYMDIIIHNFPWIIGSQLKLLHVLEHRKFNTTRLEHLVSTYIVTTQLLYFILLSNCWDMRQKKVIKFPKNFLQLHQFTKESVLTTDFLQKTVELYDLLKDATQGCYVPEMYGLCEEFLTADSSLQKAHQYLETIRKQFRTVDADLETIAINTEKALSILLRKVAFLTNYKMLTVRGIQIDNPRSQKLEYELEMGELNATKSESLRLYEDPEFRRKDDYAQSKSVVLVANDQEMGHFINLSPFIIDYHTFLEEENLEPHLYAYEDNRTYYYYAVKHNIFRSLENEKGTGLVHTKLKVKDHDNGTDRKGNNLLTATLDFEELKEATYLPENETTILSLMEEQFERFKTDFLS